ncbi:MAG TPA: hypothetical protein VGR45_10405 [Stellaceae bacterium]|nr:hypothetical protein [Stellaceae bacterium]
MQISPRDRHWRKYQVRRLDWAAGQINPFLFIVVIGLIVLYVTSLVALAFKLPVTHLDVCVQTSAPAATHKIEVK